MSSRDIPSIPVRENVPLAPFTSFGIGGPARYMAEVHDADGLRAAVRLARQRDISWCVIGGGTNIVVSDRGVNGLVIMMAAGAVEIAGSAISAGAGASLLAMVGGASANGLWGMEALAGIPGTFGGAVRGNAGAYGATVGELVEEVAALDTATLEIRTFSREECRFGYRRSMFKTRPDLVILSARLGLMPGEVERVRQAAAETIEKRGGLLRSEKCAGSYFLNPEVPEGVPILRRFEEERKIRCRNCRIPAGWLIERAGLRGRRLGGAMVSERHANYIINTGAATALEVRQLAELVRRQVRETLGVELEEEVNYLGF